MKDFDLAAAKRGATVCTRDGNDARILCFNLNNRKYKIVAAVKTSLGREYINTYNDYGRCYESGIDDDDLMMSDDDYLEKLERRESDHIGEPTEKVDWGYWRRMYAGMAMQGFCRENGTMKSANMVASVSVEYADSLIAELKKTK